MLTTPGENHVLSVGIRPNSSILSVLAYLNYKAWYAVAEFVDNSVQSYLANKDALIALHGPSFKLRIQIRLDSADEVIEVIDNAAGISAADFPRAFLSAEMPENRTGLSEFGMGMKTAACWFSDNWCVRTKALNESLEREIRFNLREIRASKPESIPVKEYPCTQLDTHYTVVRLEKLGKKFPVKRTVKKLRDHLTSIYRIYLRRGDVEIYFDEDKETLRYIEPEILRAPKYDAVDGEDFVWRKNIDFEVAGARRVTGFAGLRSEGSTTHAGFALFRRNRLILGSDDDTYRPQDIFGNSNSYRYQRLFGELTVDGFEVSHTKDGFSWDDFEDEFLEKLREQLRHEPLDLLRQAEGYRSRPTKAALKPVLDRAGAGIANEAEREAARALSTSNAANVSTTLAPPPYIISADLAGESRFEILVDGTAWYVTVRSSIDPVVTEWLAIGKVERTQLFDDPINELTIDLSMAHPFVQNFLGPKNENAELFLRFAVAVALAAEQSNRAGYKSAFAVHWLNKLLRECLSGFKA